MDDAARVRRSQFQVWEYEHEENHQHEDSSGGFLVVKFSRASQVKLELGNRSMMMATVTRNTPATF